VAIVTDATLVIFTAVIAVLFFLLDLLFAAAVPSFLLADGGFGTDMFLTAA
jgi:hypothetical protein